MGRVTQVLGATADDIAATLARVATGLPLGLIHRIRLAPALETFLDDLESVALDLFPAWLPGAKRTAVSAGAGQADPADRSTQSGPFLRDLAAEALAGWVAMRRQFPPDAWASSLIPVIAEALRCPRPAPIMDVPTELGASDELMVAAARDRIGPQ